MATSFLSHVKDPIPKSQKEKTFQELIDFLKNRSTVVIKSKSKNILMNNTAFKIDDRLRHKSRKLDFVEYSDTLWLDLDTGNVDPSIFSELCLGTQVIIYSSFSSKNDDRKWRP